MEDYDILVEEQDFLILNYQTIDFFVNRDQFSGSTSLENIKEIKSSISYLNQIFNYNGQNILLFDCDSFLKKLFNCNNINESRLCLLMRLENFTEKARPLIKKLLDANDSFSGEFLGLIISSHSEISKIAMNEIFLSPSSVRERLDSNGLYGCRFPKPGKIQFFIDLETIIKNVIQGKIDANINS